MTGPERLRHRETEVDGWVYDGSLACALAIVAWGRGLTGNMPFEVEGDDLNVHTSEGTHHVPKGDTAIIGVVGEAYSIRPEVRAAAYDAVNGRPPADYRAPLTIDRVRELHIEARATNNADRLHGIIDQLVASHEASTA